MKSIALSKGSIAMMLAAVALFPSCSKNGQQMPQGAAPEIATITLSPQTADLRSTFPATIKGKTDIEIRPQVTGFIMSTKVSASAKAKCSSPSIRLLSRPPSTRPAPPSTMHRLSSTQPA